MPSCQDTFLRVLVAASLVSNPASSFVHQSMTAPISSLAHPSSSTFYNPPSSSSLSSPSSQRRPLPTCFSTAEPQSEQQNPNPSPISIEMATNTLKRYDLLQQQFMKTDGSIGMGGGTSALTYTRTILTPNDLLAIRNCVITLVNEAHYQRGMNQQKGRIMLGICAENVQEGLMGLKTWVNALALPRGLLHGMDVDGRAIDPEELGSIYIKYNTGGCMTFTEMRRTGRGFDALWRPGDAVLEMYDGDFRGIYFSVELDDGEFRQFGVLPTDLFLEEEEW